MSRAQAEHYGSEIRARPGMAYAARPGEPDSTLTVLEIDSSEKVGIVVHVRVDGLHAHNPRGDLVPSIEAHALHPQCNASECRSPDPSSRVVADPCYENWRIHCGGVYTISVAVAVTMTEKTLNAP